MGFVVSFMGRTTNVANIYFASKKGAKINIAAFQSLDHSLKRRIYGTVSILSSQHMSFPSELLLDRFKKEMKSVLI